MNLENPNLRILLEWMPGVFALGFLAFSLYLYGQVQEMKALLCNLLDSPHWPETKFLLKALARREEPCSVQLIRSEEGPSQS